MREAGQASWRFAHGIDQLSTIALFVRDTLGLDVGSHPLNPPSLADELPDLSDRLDPERRAMAATAWIDWWQEILTVEIDQKQGPTGSDVDAWMRDSLRRRRRIFDPPDFHHLADRPEIRDAVRAVFADAQPWSDDHRHVADEREAFDWALTQSIVLEVASTKMVSPASLQACAVIVPVRGTWWTRVSAGAVVCSIAAATGPAAARDVLTDVFSSCIDG